MSESEFAELFMQTLFEQLHLELQSTHSQQTCKLTNAILKASIASADAVITNPPYGVATSRPSFPLEISAHGKSLWLHEELIDEIVDGRIIIKDDCDPPLDLQIKHEGRLLINAESELRAGPKARIPDLRKLTGAIASPILSLFVCRSRSELKIQHIFEELQTYTRKRPEPFLFCVVHSAKTQQIDRALAYFRLVRGDILVGELRPFREGSFGVTLPVIEPFAGCGVSVAALKQVSSVRKTHVGIKRRPRNQV